MNMSLLLGSGRVSLPEPITPIVTVKPEEEIDVLNRRHECNEITFIEYVAALDKLLAKEHQ